MTTDQLDMLFMVADDDLFYQILLSPSENRQRYIDALAGLLEGPDVHVERMMFAIKLRKQDVDIIEYLRFTLHQWGDMIERQQHSLSHVIIGPHLLEAHAMIQKLTEHSAEVAANRHANHAWVRQKIEELRHPAVWS